MDKQAPGGVPARMMTVAFFAIMDASIEHFVAQDSSSLKNGATRHERKD